MKLIDEKIMDHSMHKKALFKNSSKYRAFALLMSLAILLSGCAIRRSHVQGLSRSSAGYCVKGVWYYPQNFYDYDDTGLASWYGPGFHDHAKAQGEKYDQYAMTAAHKTLPLPTIVKVTNVENGKSIVVLVDDRGPYKNKRILDLSASAAKELGTYNRGVAKVRVQSLCKESNALSIYLKHYNKGKFNRTWEDIYRQEIGCRPGYRQLTVVSKKVHRSNLEEINKSKNAQAVASLIGRKKNR
ncbi:MAG: septal ring lytic transglycosylase RlpA family protein [Holosporales bacterium]|nr:septal ring lytic transglycosylase RlpA family protein [Holosporales bacterium]